LVVVLTLVGEARCDEGNPPAPGLEIGSAAGKVLVRADQILSYHWASHTLTLAPGVRETLSQSLPRGQMAQGIPFVLRVDGKVVYRGTFTTVLSSGVIRGPVIVLDRHTLDARLGEDQIQIQEGYPGAIASDGREDLRRQLVVLEALIATGKLDQGKLARVNWVARCLKEMAAIQPGMSREDLLKVFEIEGGLSPRGVHRFAYRQCPYFKVEVTFAPEKEDRGREIIATISRPFLQAPVVD